MSYGPFRALFAIRRATPAPDPWTRSVSFTAEDAARALEKASGMPIPRPVRFAPDGQTIVSKPDMRVHVLVCYQAARREGFNALAEGIRKCWPECFLP